MAVLFFLELYFFRPHLIYLTVVIILLLFFFITRQFAIASGKNEKWWNFFLLPAYFTTSLIIFTLLLSNKTLVQIIFLASIIILYLYFIAIYNYLIKENYYKKNSLENISTYSNFLTFFFVASSMYGLQSFLNISVWVLILGMILATGLIVYQVIWSLKISSNIGLLYILLVCVALVELAWSLSFLPLNFYILGIVLAICYYVVMGVARYYLLNRLDKKNIKLYLIFGFFSILTLLLTAKWL